MMTLNLEYSGGTLVVLAIRVARPIRSKLYGSIEASLIVEILLAVHDEEGRCLTFLG
jgi:hypothetical protein